MNDHANAARFLLAQANRIADSDAPMSYDERYAQRIGAVATAHVHALLDIAESLRTIAEQGPGGAS